MASQSAPSSAAMDVALGEEVIISMFQWQCNSSFYVIAINYFKGTPAKLPGDFEERM